MTVAHDRQTPNESSHKVLRPSDAQLALCSLFANRWFTDARWLRATRRFGVPTDLTIHQQIEDRHVGLRMVTFMSPYTWDPSTQEKVAAVVFAFRGTRLHKSSNLHADFQVLKDRQRNLFIVQRAVSLMEHAKKQIQKQRSGVRYQYYTTGHSLGGFVATACTILTPFISECIAFEGPGMTSFYHNLAEGIGDDDYWRGKVTNYLTVPNPINMCQRHLGRVIRVHTRLHLKTDAFHVIKCLFGTGIRVVNWLLAANILLKLYFVVSGLSLSAWSCYQSVEAGFLELYSAFAASECSWEVAIAPAHMVASAYWTLNAASAYLAGRLGMSFTQVFEQHSMWNLAQAFNAETGLPQSSVEMESWPRMEKLGQSLTEYLWRLLVESFFPTACAEGIRVMFDKNALIEARIRALPGYVEMSNDTASIWSASDFCDIVNVSSFDDLSEMMALEDSAGEQYLQLTMPHQALRIGSW